MGKILRGEEAENLVDLLSDESRVTGTAEGLSQPESEEELKAILAECSETSAKVTVSAGLTGISAGGVPQGGIGINLARMNLITGIRCEGESWFVTCQPGVSLDELRTALEKKNLRASTLGRKRAALPWRNFAPPRPMYSPPTRPRRVPTSAVW